jgi:hypothetical protein
MTDDGVVSRTIERAALARRLECVREVTICPSLSTSEVALAVAAAVRRSTRCRAVRCEPGTCRLQAQGWDACRPDGDRRAVNRKLRCAGISGPRSPCGTNQMTAGRGPSSTRDLRCFYATRPASPKPRAQVRFLPGASGRAVTGGLARSYCRASGAPGEPPSSRKSATPASGWSLVHTRSSP